MTQIRTVIVCAFALSLAACFQGGTTDPSPHAIVTLEVGMERFRIELTTSEQIAAARAAKDGGAARIPIGRIVSGTGVNTGWSWHLEDVLFAEVAIEVCDGRPSDVEIVGPLFGAGRFCPWGASILRID